MSHAPLPTTSYDTSLTPAVAASPDVQEILRLDGVWGDAASAKQTDQVVALYAADGTLVWPGQPAAHGTAAITAGWTQMLADPTFHALRFTAERIEVSGDLASDFGRVEMTVQPPTGAAQTLVAKYLVVWRREAGQWRVLYDAWNTNDAETPAA